MADLPIVLLVHGMGTHPVENMSRDFKTGLTEAANGFGASDFDLDEHVELVEFNYSENLDAIRTKLAEQADSILQHFKGMPGQDSALNLVRRLINYQSNLDEDEMIYTHWLDVLLYGATFYGEQLRVELSTKINNLKARAAGRDIHIVAHSLGTALTHDTLNKLYRDEGTINDRIPDLKPGIDNIKCLWSFASVNRLVSLLNGVSDTKSVVRSGPRGCTDYLYCIRHELDPFTWYRQWKPNIENGRNFTTKVVRNINTHSFREYVADPDVARYMLLQMTRLQSPKRTDAFNQYKNLHKAGAITGLSERIKQETQDLRAREPGSTPELLQSIRTFIETAKALSEGV